MDIHLHNSWDYKKDDWWEWSAYLTGPDLPEVDRVEYILHKTFKNPVRVIKEPADGFRLDTEGWGTFELKAIVHLKDGNRQLLTHEVELKDKPKTGRTDA